MFGIYGRDTFNKPKSNIAIFFTFIHDRWLKIFPFFLFFILVIVMIIVGNVWYKYVYTKELTGEEKTTYVNQKKSEVTFNQKQFDIIKERVQKRKERFSAEKQDYQDIFYK